MDEFLKEDVTYISNEEIDSAWWAIKGDENAIKETFKILLGTKFKFFLPKLNRAPFSPLIPIGWP